VENNHVDNKWRPDRNTIVKQQGKEVLGADLSSAVSFKDRFAVRFLVMLNTASHIAGWISRSDREAE
jgi:hypothetical protein